MEKCLKCGAELAENAKFCSNCGAEVLKKVPCKACGTLLDATAAFCYACGAKQTEDMSEAPRPISCEKDETAQTSTLGEQSKESLNTDATTGDAPQEPASEPVVTIAEPVVSDTDKQSGFILRPAPTGMSVQDCIVEYEDLQRKAKRKRLKVTLIILFILLLLGGGGAAYLLLSSPKGNKKDEQAKEEQMLREREEAQRLERERLALQREKDSLSIATAMMNIPTTDEFHTLRFNQLISGEMYLTPMEPEVEEYFDDDEWGWGFGNGRDLAAVIREQEARQKFQSVRYAPGELENDLPSDVTFMENGEFLVLKTTTEEEPYNMYPHSSFAMETHQYANAIPAELLDTADFVFESENGEWAYLKKISMDDVRMLTNNNSNNLKRYLSPNRLLYVFITRHNVCCLQREGDKVKMRSNMTGEEDQFDRDGNYSGMLIMDIYTGRDTKNLLAFVPGQTPSIFVEKENTFYYLKEVRLSIVTDSK